MESTLFCTVVISFFNKINHSTNYTRSAEGEKTSTSSGDATSTEQVSTETESYPVEHFTNFAKGRR